MPLVCPLRARGIEALCRDRAKAGGGGSFRPCKDQEFCTTGRCTPAKALLVAEVRCTGWQASFRLASRNAINLRVATVSPPPSPHGSWRLELHQRAHHPEPRSLMQSVSHCLSLAQQMPQKPSCPRDPNRSNQDSLAPDPSKKPIRKFFPPQSNSAPFHPEKISDGGF